MHPMVPPGVPVSFGVGLNWWAIAEDHIAGPIVGVAVVSVHTHSG